ncbi:hypothetical protein YC2023_086540 [Brassica napus]
MWGAAWLLKATNDLYYKNFVESLGDGDQPDIFNWDSKYAGAYVLLSQVCLVLILNNCGSFVLSQAQKLLNKDINFELRKILPDARSSQTLPLSLPITLKYMKATQHTFDCGNSTTIVLNALISVSKKQVDYILGANPIKMS